MLSLEGYRLLDLSRLVPGPWASHILADMGMEVIKIEDPAPKSGMPRDSMSPPIANGPEEDVWQAYNTIGRNKRSLAINLRQPAGVEILLRLAETADVILLGFRPGVAERLGIGYDDVRKRNGRITYCSISGFGLEGRYSKLAGHDTNYVAMAGVTSLTRDKNGEPVPLGFSAANMTGGTYAALGIVAALLKREKTGNGSRMDVSLTSAALNLISPALGQHLRTGAVPKVSRLDLRVIKCKDGKYISTRNSERHFWERFCKVINRPDLLDCQNAEGERADWATAEIRQVFLTKTRDEWFDLLLKADTCVAPITELDDIPRDEYYKEAGMVWELEHPQVGKLLQTGCPIEFFDGRAVFRNFAPRLGEHTAEILGELGLPESEISTLAKQGVVLIA